MYTLILAQLMKSSVDVTMLISPQFYLSLAIYIKKKISIAKLT